MNDAMANEKCAGCGCPAGPAWRCRQTTGHALDVFCSAACEKKSGPVEPRKCDHCKNKEIAFRARSAPGQADRYFCSRSCCLAAGARPPRWA